MKHVIFIIAFFGFLRQAPAQTNLYHPFPDSNAVWNMRITGSECMSCYQRSYFLSGDTVINGTDQHKTYCHLATGISMPPWNSCFYSSGPGGTPVYAGALRQDTSLRRVYFTLPGQLTDTLLYDFSLGVGDTLPHGLNNLTSAEIYVDAIDSILIGSSYRKRFVLGNTVSQGLIEGIGSTTGLLDELYVFECGGLLECYAQDGITLYGGNCQILDQVSIPDTEQEIYLFPNPAVDKLNAQRLKSEKSKTHWQFSAIRIYDLASREAAIPVHFFNQSHQITIDVSHYLPGIYIVEIAGSGRPARGYFVKQ